MLNVVFDRILAIIGRQRFFYQSFLAVNSSKSSLSCDFTSKNQFYKSLPSEFNFTELSLKKLQKMHSKYGKIPKIQNSKNALSARLPVTVLAQILTFSVFVTFFSKFSKFLFQNFCSTKNHKKISNNFYETRRSYLG